MADGLEFCQGLATNPLGGRIRCHQLRVEFFQLEEFPEKLVVFAVRYQRVIQLVIAVRMEVDLLPQLLDSFPEILSHSLLLSFGLLQEFAAHGYVFVQFLVDKDEDRILGLVGHPGNDIGDPAAYFLFLFFLQFAGDPDADIGHDYLLVGLWLAALENDPRAYSFQRMLRMRKRLRKAAKLYTHFKESWLCFAKDAIVTLAA